MPAASFIAKLATRSTQKTPSTPKRAFQPPAASARSFGAGRRLRVRRMAPSNVTTSPGSTSSTDSRLKRTPLPSTRPMSRPMVNDMNTRHAMPAMVVTELEARGAKPPVSARTMACSGSSQPLRSWR